MDPVAGMVLRLLCSGLESRLTRFVVDVRGALVEEEDMSHVMYVDASSIRSEWCRQMRVANCTVGRGGRMCIQG